MTARHYDLIVIGLGAMGAAALYQASARGAAVLGIDRFDPPHNFGSSHGDTRITRNAIGEGEMYMPFIQRSNAIWRELEAISGNALFHKSGGLSSYRLKPKARVSTSRAILLRSPRGSRLSTASRTSCSMPIR